MENALGGMAFQMVDDYNSFFASQKTGLKPCMWVYFNQQVTIPTDVTYSLGPTYNL